MILGASSGFGAAAARAYAKAGMNITGVHLDGRASIGNVEALEGEIRALGRESWFLSGRTPSRQAVWTELTALVRGGANLEAVRELAGHSKLHTTQRYVHATGADLRDAIARLPGN